jgi:hypothetical protein
MLTDFSNTAARPLPIAVSKPASRIPWLAAAVRALIGEKCLDDVGGAVVPSFLEYSRSDQDRVYGVQGDPLINTV